MSTKILGFAELLETRRRWKDDGLRVVWTNGAFDLFHAGHVRALKAAKQFGDRLVVGVNSDASVRRAKGHDRPILDLRERMTVVAAMEDVDAVVELDADTPAEMLDRLRPDVHAKGEEYEPPHGRPIPEAEVVRRYGGEIVFTPSEPGISTTEIIRRLRARETDR